MEPFEYKHVPNKQASIDALEELEKRCFSVPWRRKDFEDALAGSLYDVYGCFDGETLVGYVVFVVLFEDCELMNLAVAPGRRRAGIGKKLLALCLEKAAEKGARRVFLEVREHNAAARALYEKAGFVPYGRRRGYYRQPPEDAILYVKLFGEQSL